MLEKAITLPPGEINRFISEAKRYLATKVITEHYSSHENIEGSSSEHHPFRGLGAYSQ